MIMIHGTPVDEDYPEWFFRGLDWTNGCIALLNADMQELWDLVPDGTGSRYYLDPRQPSCSPGLRHSNQRMNMAKTMPAEVHVRVLPMKKLLSLAVAASIGISAHVHADRLTTELIKPIEPYVSEQPEKVELGKKLWFDPRLSMSGFISCNSCHNLSTGGVTTCRLPSGTTGRKVRSTRRPY